MMNNYNELWKAVLGEIEVQISRPNFLTWLKQSQIVGKDEKENTIFVGLPNNFAREWVKNKYHKIIFGSLRNFDNSIKGVEYVIFNPAGTVFSPILEKKSKTGLASANKASLPLLELKIDPKTNLNPRYTFESFVVGSSNELAHAAAMAIVKDIGQKYNPFFVYGGVGLGKTHLLQAMGNEIKKSYQNKINVFYTTSEKFVSDVVWAIRNKQMDDIKKKYRNVDVLIIDDIQFIGGKERSEEEFFHTFNVLYENNKQIVISSDRPPGAIPTLTERLRSRFEGGMIADITYPDYEMRLAILKNKVQERSIFIEDKILEQVAFKVQKNIRELEGVLNKIIFYQEYKKEKIDNQKLEEIIIEASQTSSKNVTINDIIKAVTDFYEVSPNEIANRNRKQEIVEPRQIIMYLLREILKLSYPHIGERLGKRDHTTAIHSCEKVARDINRNAAFNQKIMMIKEKIYKMS